MASADRELRFGAGVQLPVDAADGGRRHLFDGRPAPRGNRGGRGDRRAALDAPARRRGAGGGGSAPPLGPRPGVPRRRRRRADLLRDAGVPAGRSEREDRAAPDGLRGRRDRRSDAEHGSGHRSAGGGDRTARDAAGGGAAPLSSGPPTCRGAHRGRCATRRGTSEASTRRRALRKWIFHTIPGRRRVRQRHVAERLVALHGEHRGVGSDQRRPGAGHRVSPDRDADQRLLRRPPPRRQPLLRQYRGPRHGDRGSAVALPGHPPRRLGLGLPLRPGAGRRGDGRRSCGS